MNNLKKPIAIHPRRGSFSDGWIAYCERNEIPYKLVNCYDSNIVSIVAECAGLMWHWSHTDPAAARFARQLTYSLEARGLRMFPNSSTGWHFDDKLGQKYLFEALDIPHVPTHVFYRKADAIKFIRRSSFPMVFKLTRGAGSQNVALIKSTRQAKRMISRSFGRGWEDSNRSYALRELVRKDKKRQGARRTLVDIGRLIYPHPDLKFKRNESAYFYLQDFVPDNDSDIRVTVIGGKAFGFRRMVREGDFRASGSGTIIYDRDAVPLECVEIALVSAQKIGMQSAAFDFVFSNGVPLVVEVSYGFSAEATRWVPGYWDRGLNWHEGTINSEEMIIEDFLSELT